MKNPFKLSVLVLALLLPAVATAEDVYDFDVDGIYYKILENGDEVCVTYKTYRIISHTEYFLNDYTGDITIPATVTFNGKSFLVTEISDHAFYRNGSVTSVTIPASVAAINKCAFYFCTELKTVTCLATMPPVIYCSDAFGGVYYQATLHVPEGYKLRYSKHTYWKDFSTIIDDADVGDPTGDADYLKCDVNGDGVVNIADVNKVIAAILSH